MRTRLTLLGAAPLAALLAASSPAAPGKPASRAPLAGLDSFMATTMKDWKMPGTAVAVVKGGEVVLLEGYGLRNLEGKLPVTPRTIFPIASITKSFTVAALASLAAEGKLDWDEPVHDLLPGFRLYDDVATIRVTPRDLVTHRTGLPRHDAMWYFGEPTRATMVEHLRFLEPSRDLRSAWQYNNLAFVTAGYLAGKLAGSSWEDVVRTRLFEPLGMRRSGFSIGAAKSDPDVAHPYQKDDQQEVKAIPYYEQTEMGPAGTIVSTADDLSRYLLMHLAKGKFDGRQVLAEADVTAMQTPQMVTPTPLVHPEISHTSYGMGLFVTTYRGHKLVHHGGNIDGFSLLLSFLPQDDMGVIVLTNLNGTPYPSIVTYQIYDRLLGLGPVDWNARYLDRQSKTRASEDEAKAKGYTPRKTGTHPSHDLADYVGDYEHPGYGLVHVGGAGEDLTLTYNKASSTLKHFHYDVFEVPASALDRLERTKVMFRTGWNGEIDGLSIGLEPQVKDIVFARVADRPMRERGFLEPLAGAYELGPTPVTITLRGDGVLVLAVPGQPPRELEPVRGTTFTVKGLSGYQVVFKKDDSGRVVEVAFQQPGANYVAKRKQ